MGGAVGACISHPRPSRPLRTCCLLEALLDKLGPLLTRHFARGFQSTLAGDLKDAYIVWLEKPNKPPTTVGGGLRPI